jgi:hypothetical protein
VELGLALYAWIGVLVALLQQNHGPLFFLLTCALAYSYMLTLNMREWRWHWRQERQGTAVSPLR